MLHKAIFPVKGIQLYMEIINLIIAIMLFANFTIGVMIYLILNNIRSIIETRIFIYIKSIDYNSNTIKNAIIDNFTKVLNDIDDIKISNNNIVTAIRKIKLKNKAKNSCKLKNKDNNTTKKKIQMPS